MAEPNRMWAYMDLPDGFRVLVDAPDDGYIEDRGWVPVQFAATPDEAIATVRRELVIEPDAVIEVAGREWHRRQPDVTQRVEDDFWWRSDGDPCEACSGSGKEPEDPDEQCDECRGYGTDGYALDYEPWERCEQGTEGAVEMWVVERLDPDAAAEGQGDERG